MRINFVAISDSSLASHRFRVNKPYELLTELGYDVTIKQFVDEKADVNVFQKHIQPEQVLDWMEKTKTKKIFDVCDDHFDRELGAYYKEACTLANALTCTNTRMEKRLKELFPDKPVYVFFDPINTIKGNPKWSEKPKIIWFGHKTNFQVALPWLQETVNLGHNLTVVSNMDIKGNDFIFVPYEAGWVEENLKNYDVVLLPQGNEPWINMKSENRFVDALNAGCVVVFNNDTLYGDFNECNKYSIYAADNSMKNAMDVYVSGGTSFLPGIEQAQINVSLKYSDEKIKEQLKEIFNA